MRRVAALALIAVFMGAGAGSAFTERTKDASFALMHVGRDGRTLVLDYTAGRCEGRVTARRVRETRSRIAIRLRQREAVPDPEANEGCTDDLRTFRLRLRLGHPVLGRRITGPSRSSFSGYQDRRFGDQLVKVVPRVRGLAPEAARRLLRAQGFRTRTRYVGSDRFRSRVAAQSPMPGSAPRASRPRLTLSVRR